MKPTYMVSLEVPAGTGDHGTNFESTQPNLSLVQARQMAAHAVRNGDTARAMIFRQAGEVGCFVHAISA